MLVNLQLATMQFLSNQQIAITHPLIIAESVLGTAK